MVCFPERPEVDGLVLDAQLVFDSLVEQHRPEDKLLAESESEPVQARITDLEEENRRLREQLKNTTRRWA